MSIIKCPECGRQISDKAPVCPNCGVQIAGKIVKCPQCGEVYFSDQEMCPICHHLTNPAATTSQQPVQQAQAGYQAPESATKSTIPPANTPSQRKPGGTQPPTPPRGNDKDWSQPPIKPKKKNHTALIVGFIVAAIFVGMLFVFYNNAKNDKERDAYEYAMKSTDPLVLQTYLDNYPSAPEEHRDSIMSHLEAIKQMDTDWSNAVVSGSKAALEDYLAKHPDSPHRAEAQHKIDSLDWVFAQNENTMEAIQTYLNEHANGEHVDEANNLIKELKAKTVQPEEKQMVVGVLRNFFQSINARSESGVEDAVSPLMTSFLGKSDATKSDAVTFMNKIYKEDITNMNWHLNGDYKINKKEVGDEEYEYTVQCSAVQDIERTDETKEKTARYRINATISPDQKISALNMVKILQ